MKITNKKTGKDVSSIFLKYLKGEISKKTFETLAELKDNSLKNINFI